MTPKLPTILFVDDEIGILDGLRRKLSDQDDRWIMLFATGGEPALETMKSNQVDVVVTDMRMPNMDGATLLEEVSKRYPSAARFILSGFSERESIFRTLGPAHQYFVKPCDTDILVKAIERSLVFRQRLNSEHLLDVVAGTKTIPAMPQALTELLRQLQSPDGSTTEIAKIISSDIGLTAQVLKLINSAYFFVPSKVADVFQAVKLLGFDLIRSVAVLAGVFEAFRTIGIDMKAVQRLENRSLMIGAVAKRIAQIEGMDENIVDHCFCSGMLAHVGSLILFANRAEQMAALQKDLGSSGAEIVAYEQRRFGASHPELSGCLLNLWGFSDTIVEAVLCHHHPSDAAWSISDRVGPTAIVHVAQHIVKPEPADSSEMEAWLAPLDQGYLARIGADDRMDDWIEAARRIKKELPD